MPPLHLTARGASSPCLGSIFFTAIFFFLFFPSSVSRFFFIASIFFLVSCVCFFPSLYFSRFLIRDFLSFFFFLHHDCVFSLSISHSRLSFLFPVIFPFLSLVFLNPIFFLVSGYVLSFSRFLTHDFLVSSNLSSIFFLAFSYVQSRFLIVDLLSCFQLRLFFFHSFLITKSPSLFSLFLAKKKSFFFLYSFFFFSCVFISPSRSFTHDNLVTIYTALFLCYLLMVDLLFVSPYLFLYFVSLYFYCFVSRYVLFLLSLAFFYSIPFLVSGMIFFLYISEFLSCF